MATVQRSESRRLYSWLWDSHNSPKNSKWLQENLTDMDAKVKSMIKLIEEDADSFARRAEMYYKKRPELMKLVEEFYRAYRALAERYNHATEELRHAHRTIAKAFPDQVPLELIEDSPSKPFDKGGPHTPEIKCPARVLFDPDVDFLEDSLGGPHSEDSGNVRGLTQLHNENQNLKERAGKAENEVNCLRKALIDMEAEKEKVLLGYQRCLKKLSDIEGELEIAQNDSIRLNEKASRGVIEVQTLKEALIELESEKNAGLVKNEAYLEKISNLEDTISLLKEESKSECQTLKDEISRLNLEKEEASLRYKQCVEKISVLENLISGMENEFRMLKKQAEKAENEAFELKKLLADLNEEREASAIKYKCCLEKISKLEKDLSRAKEEVKRLNNDVVIGNLKLEASEEKRTLLEMSNLSLRAEANNLAKKIADKDEELSRKLEELKSLQSSLQDEKLHYSQIEATLENLQNSHSRSQDDQISLAVELKNALQMLKDLEVSKNGLEEEIRHVRDENRDLSRMNSSSEVSIGNLQNEIFSLREIKARLEKEVSRHIGVSNSLQHEISCLKEEINGLKRKYEDLVEQVEAAGLNPKCLGFSIMGLKDENSKLREICENGSKEKALLSKKLENMEELLKEKVVLESSLSELKTELENSREKAKASQGTLLDEKASLLSQLKAITENMHNLLGKNAVLENSLSSAKVELEGLREKSKGLEEICELLKNERSFLLNERGTLVFKLENVERSLECLEKKYNGLEEKYADLEKEKKAVNYQVEELKVSLSVEKQERTISEFKNETLMAGLENQIRLLQEENRWKKKEYEDELDKALKAQFEISIFQKFIKDMEEKNYSLIIECRKHVEASKLAEKLISELERESLEQQVESEVLLDEIERLRFGIYDVFRALDETGGPEDKIENFVSRILETIEDMKCSVSKNEDDKQLIIVENSVLSTLLQQLESKVVEIELHKKYLEREFKIMAEKLGTAENEKDIVMMEFSDLKEEKIQVDKQNDDFLLEFLASDNQLLILRRFGEEKLMEVKLLIEDLKRQHDVNSGLEKELRVFKERLEFEKAETLLIKDSVRKSENEMQEIREYSVQMKRDILRGDQKLEAAENLNSKLRKMVDELKNDVQESLQIRENQEKTIFELSEENSIQNKEIESLRTAGKYLGYGLDVLQEEIQEKATREQILSSELKDKSNEFELWEAEAASFYFDLQISSINEVVFKNKAHELSGMCRNLENENSSKNSEIEQMKGKVWFMESEINGLKSQLHAYSPIVAALRDDIMSLEKNTLLRTKLKASRNKEPELLEVAADPRISTSEIIQEDESLASLQNLHARIKAVGKIIEETNKPVFLPRRSNSSSKSKQESTTTGEIEQLKKTRRYLGRKKSHANEETPKLQKIKTKATEVWNGMRMKDIPLDQISSNKKRVDDQMLELSENENAENDKKIQTIGESLRMSCEMTEKDIVYVRRGSEPPSTDSDMEKELGVDMLEVSNRISEANKEVSSKKRVLERLASDAQKLENLQTTLEILKTKLETNKTDKKVTKKNDVDFETVQEQLVEAEETVVHLVEMNGELVRKLRECPSPDGRVFSPRRRKVVDQARKGSERIGRLELELRKIQFVVLKMEDERKNKGKSLFFRNKTIVLRDFIYNGKRKSGKRKKGAVCGCFRPSTSRNGRSEV